MNRGVTVGNLQADVDEIRDEQECAAFGAAYAPPLPARPHRIGSSAEQLNVDVLAFELCTGIDLQIGEIDERGRSRREPTRLDPERLEHRPGVGETRIDRGHGTPGYEIGI